MNLLSIGFQMGSDNSIRLSRCVPHMLAAGIGGSGVVLAVNYWLVRRSMLPSAEEVFPQAVRGEFACQPMPSA